MAGRAEIDPRAARKRALVLESELNRALFIADLRELRQGACGVADLGALAKRTRRWLPLVGSLAGWWTGTRGRRRRRNRDNQSRRGELGHDRRWDVLLAFLKLAGPLLLAGRRRLRRGRSDRPSRD